MSVDLKAKGQSDMPTAAKAVAAAVMAGFAWLLADFLEYRYPEFATRGGLPNVRFALLGLYCGWRYVGGPAREGYVKAWMAGISGALLGFAYGVVGAAVIEVWVGMGKHFYKTVPALVDAFFKHLAEGALLIFDGPTFAAVLVSGLLTGVLAGFAARLWN